MVAASDLRIGNWVTWQDDEELFPLKVVGITNGDLFIKDADGDENDVGYESVRPIPLTPSILEKCGFERIGNWIFALKDAPEEFRISVRNSGETKYMVSWMGNLVGIHIEYVHQFQNVTYALTGTELKINL